MNNVWRTLIDGFTYGGNVMHCIINYSLIVVTVLPHLLKSNPYIRNRNAWLSALILSLVVQVIIWFVFNDSGVSVIWSSMAGFNTMILLKRGPDRYGKKLLLILSLVTALSAIIYYAVTLPLITTCAHVIAVLMGFGFFYLFGAGRRGLNASNAG
ncbi:MAG: hypothetical protein WDO16_22405 [Bacteroidota bacterium]